jgi:hypothetical protein
MFEGTESILSAVNHELVPSFLKHFSQILQNVIYIPIQNPYCDHRNFESVLTGLKACSTQHC